MKKLLSMVLKSTFFVFFILSISLIKPQIALGLSSSDNNYETTTSVIHGDADGNGSINENDSNKVKGMLLGTEDTAPSADERAAIDVDGDSRITSADYVLINRKIDGRIADFPVDKIDTDQTLYLIGHDYKSLNISAESDGETFTTYTNVFEGLYRETVNTAGDHIIVPALAKDTKVSDDGLIYTFTLRDAKWSDGKPITAYDFEFSWKRLINTSYDFTYSNFLNMVKNVPEYKKGMASINDVGIKVLDYKTFQVTLGSVTPYFGRLLTFCGLVPQREDIVNIQGYAYGQDYRTMVYNGPFIISNYQRGSKIVYSKNPNYWDAVNVHLNNIAGFMIDHLTAINRFLSKQLDNIGASGDYISQLDSQKDAGGYDHIIGNDTSTYYMIFNMKNSVFTSAKVRQAMSAAFDRQSLLNTVYKRYVPSYGFICPQLACGNNIYRNDVPEPTKNLINSVKDPKALFIEGLKDMNMDPDPSKCKLKLLMGALAPTSTAYAQYVQNQFQTKIGVQIEIQYSANGPSYFESRANGEFDLCSGGWGADYNDVSNFFGIFLSSDGNNSGKWSDSQYDDLISKGAKELDQTKRLNYYKQAEQILCVDDPAIIPTYYEDIQTFRHKYVKDMVIPLFGGYYSLRDTYIQGRK